MKTANIVQAINDTIKASLTDARFGSAKYSGIAITHEKDGNRFATCYTLDGEGLPINPDDNHALQIYHKNNGSITQQSDGEEFGNQTNYLTKTTAMSMIVIGQRKQLQLSVEDLQSLIEMCIPAKATSAFLSDNGLKSVFINVGQANYDSIGIYNREFQKDKKNTDPRLLICEIKYSIECSFNVGCVNSICS